jgi:hypothetical protein
LRRQQEYFGIVKSKQVPVTRSSLYSCWEGGNAAWLTRCCSRQGLSRHPQGLSRHPQGLSRHCEMKPAETVIN